MKLLSRFTLMLLLLLLLVGPAAPQVSAQSARHVVLEGFYNPG
jgi:hypothetical protein